MRHYLLFFMLMVSCAGYSQEFKVYENGLIYDERTMTKLSVIVDSLNLKFRTCDLSHPYYSYAQGMATLVKVPSKDALKQIRNGISLDAYRQRYPGSKKDELWLVKSRYRDHKDKRFIEYSGLPYGWGDEPSITVEDERENDKSSGWIVDEEESLAFYFSKLESYTLPAEYARMVLYVDCMIDTTAEIYFPQAKGLIYQQVESGSKPAAFIEWANQFPNRPEYPDYKKLEEKEFYAALDHYYDNYRTWDSLRMLNLDENMRNVRWQSLLAEAADESVNTGNTSAELELYVSRYLSKELALKMKRSRRVIGNCSQDQSPRYHAMEICQLAAETAKWDIFLRSHLDIMNDRFERMSDGSYAWADRKTYLKELEDLDIRAIDLLLGTSLRVANVSEKHYRSSIGRAGRALADAKDKAALEQRLIAMVQDEKLDPFNRLLMAYLFSNYAHNLDTSQQRDDKLKKLNAAVATMPEYARKVWKKG